MAVELHPPIAAGSSAAAPVTTDDRLHTLDILRGLALFGPLEWLWRMITYARPQSLRRAGS